MYLRFCCLILFSPNHTFSFNANALCITQIQCNFKTATLRNSFIFQKKNEGKTYSTVIFAQIKGPDVYFFLNIHLIFGSAFDTFGILSNLSIPVHFISIIAPI